MGMDFHGIGNVVVPAFMQDLERRKRLQEEEADRQRVKAEQEAERQRMGQEINAMMQQLFPGSAPVPITSPSLAAPIVQQRSADAERKRRLAGLRATFGTVPEYQGVFDNPDVDVDTEMLSLMGTLADKTSKRQGVIQRAKDYGLYREGVPISVLESDVAEEAKRRGEKFSTNENIRQYTETTGTVRGVEQGDKKRLIAGKREAAAAMGLDVPSGLSDEGFDAWYTNQTGTPNRRRGEAQLGQRGTRIVGIAKSILQAGGVDAFSKAISAGGELDMAVKQIPDDDEFESTRAALLDLRLQMMEESLRPPAPSAPRQPVTPPIFVPGAMGGSLMQRR